MALCLLGLASLTYGAWLVYEPAAFITAGLVLLAAGVLYVRGSRVVE